MNTVDNLSLVLQLINLELLFKDFNNTDLMNELQKIIQQNNKIIELLERNKDGRETKEWYKY